jgi:hypothetical protein
VCDTVAIFYPDARDLANIIDMIAEITYHTVSGCMTAQVAHEINYQMQHASDAVNADGNQAGFNDVSPGIYGNQEPAVAVPVGNYEPPRQEATGANAMMQDNKKW